jgi:methyl coenzyme M reductase alpha subunit
VISYKELTSDVTQYKLVEEELYGVLEKKFVGSQRAFDELGAMDVISQAMAFGLGDSISQQ